MGINWGPCSNAEFVPPERDAVVAETERRVEAQSTQVARRLNIDRRRFVASLSGTALALLTLDACSKEKHAAERAVDPTLPAQPGGTFAVPTTAVTEPEVATTVLSGNEFVFDVQTHLLPYDLTRSSSNFGSSFPQANCGESDSRKCFDLDHFLDAMFLQSDTSAIVLSALPVYGVENPLTADAMAETRRIAEKLCGDNRVYMMGQAASNVGSVQASFDTMSATASKHKLVAWKTYTHTGQSLRLDDGDRSLLQVGQRLVRHAVTTGVPVIAVHKGFGSDPVDIGPAAVANRDVNFLIYHSGFEGVFEGPYDGARPNAGVDRLIQSLERAGVGKNDNVYVELGSTWHYVMADLTQAAHVLGKLLNAVGPDRVLWGTDSIWYGSPQDQIQAFRAFQFTAEFQERYGYPALTRELKRMVLGLNAAHLFNVDPAKVPCSFSRQDLERLRQERRLTSVLHGPTTRREFATLMRSPLAVLL
ncbi:MAG: amidohydrolase family protein [Acidimicrobiales bacterium]